MSAQTRHRIIRQVLDLDVDSSAGAHDVQDRLAMPFRDGNLPGLEKLFDRIASPNVHLRVDRLEVDLGTVTGTDWYEKFFDRLSSQLNLAFEKSDTQGAVFGADVEIGRQTRSDSAFERLCFFLEHGRLPWWSGRPSESDWIESVSARLTPVQWQALLNVVQRSRHARVRFVGAVHDPILERAVAEWAGLTGARRMLQVLPSLVRGQTQHSHWRQRFWQVLVGRIVTDAVDGGPLLRELLRVLIECSREAEAPEPANAVWATIRRRFDALDRVETPLPEPWRMWLQQELGSGLRPVTAEAPADPGPGVNADDLAEEMRHPRETTPDEHEIRKKRTPGDVRTKPELRDEVLPPGISQAEHVISIQDWLDQDRARAEDKQTTPAFHLADEETAEVFIDGAGVVIVHPFLSELFASRGLLIDEDFVDDDARHKGVRLLAYLTFGTEVKAEYELLLAKLLCNVPWDVPLADVELDDEDRTACDELLEAVLGHWTVLKGCSVPWMREQYFLRDGKLEQVDHGWKLTVERHAQDVLLAKLPWGFGMIRLPWQPAYLYMNWLD